MEYLTFSYKKGLILLMLLPLCAAFTHKTKEELYPTIVLSNKYNRIGDQADNVHSYYIRPSAGLVLDARKLKLTNAKNIPSKLYLVSDGTIYSMPYSAEGIMIADALHLSNVQGVAPFDGFKANKSYAIGIGEVDRVDDKISMKTNWACLLKVK